MARKRRKPRTARRRRRIGAVSFSAGSPLVKFGSIAAGFMLSGKINQALEKVTGGKVDPKILNGVLAAGGLYFALMAKGRKSTLTQVAAGLAAGAGSKGLLSEFGVINGFQDVPVLGGYQDVPVLGSYEVPQAVNGFNVPAPSGSVVGSIGGVEAGEEGGRIGD